MYTVNHNAIPNVLSSKLVTVHLLIITFKLVMAIVHHALNHCDVARLNVLSFAIFCTYNYMKALFCVPCKS